jgi:hypothetical protein
MTCLLKKQQTAQKYGLLIIHYFCFRFQYRLTQLYDKRINLKLQFPLLHIIPAGEDFYF